MVIRTIQQASSGVYEITPESGSAFFLRADYLCVVPEERLSAGAGFAGEEEEDLLHAALVYAAERAAMSYLARTEHCRAGLEAKLLKKGFDRQAVARALDYLEGVRYLDDGRFAGAWLRSRAIGHLEGRARLELELAARGVGRDAAKAALDEYFSAVDEVELCRRAMEKLLRFTDDEQKLRTSLARRGFSSREISRVIQERHGIFS